MKCPHWGEVVMGCPLGDKRGIAGYTSEPCGAWGMEGAGSDWVETKRVGYDGGGLVDPFFTWHG